MNNPTISEATKHIRFIKEYVGDGETEAALMHIGKLETILDAAARVEPTTVILGFASWANGRFELIIRDEDSCEETTLVGQLEPNQFEQVSKILPTCVLVKASLGATPTARGLQSEQTGEPWLLADYSEAEVEIVAGKERHIAFLNNDMKGRGIAKQIVDAHNASLSAATTKQNK